MHSEIRELYLETQVSTATPQKLRLMLIEGAIRFTRLAQQAWQDDQPDDAIDFGIRCRSILAELMSGIRSEQSELAREVASLYNFLFRTLNEAQQSRKPEAFVPLLAILSEERQTWQAVCDQMPDAPDFALRQQHAPQEIMAPRFASFAASEFGVDSPTPISLGGFSIDA